MVARDGAAPGGTLDVLLAAVEGSPEAVGIVREATVVRANLACARLFGFDDAAALVGRSLLELVAPVSHPVVEARVAARRDGEQGTSVRRVAARRRDGTGFELEATTVAIELDGVRHILIVCRDASSQRQREEELREREELYRAVFEVNAAIKLLVDPVDGAIVDANPAAAEFYGWPLDELRRMRIAQINLASPEEVAANIAEARAGHRRAFRFRHRVADGRVRDVEVHSGPITVRGRALLLSIVHDVTERNQLEEQLRRAQRLDAVGRLAAGIAHDFNNLLTVVMASAQLAERHTPPESRTRAFLADVRHAAQRGAELTRQLLAFARQQSLAPAPIDLVPTLTRMTGLLQRVLGDDLEVVAELPPTLPAVRFDPGQLELAIINVALNARDAMPGGGRLTVRAVEVAAPVASFGGDRAVEVTLEDTGSGMDEETLGRAFEPFFTTKPPGKGTGLGLATVYGIVTQSGGHIAIDSAPGRGTRVHLWLPLDASPAVAARDAERLAPCAAERVLVVDDRRDVREAVSRALGDAGLDVISAAGVGEALVVLAARGGAVDVVLSDVAMPERSGVELAAQVRARWPGVPVVLMSGDAVTPEAAADAFIAKPFALGEVLAVLDRVVRARRA